MPQVDRSVVRHLGWVIPVPRGRHWPSKPGAPHVKQASSQATLQQYPSAQNPESQSSAFVHFPPGGSFPQLFP